MRLMRIGIVALSWASVVLVQAELARATPPWQRLLPLRRIDAEKGNAYPISEDNGPWMIIAATFRGEWFGSFWRGSSTGTI